MTADIEKALKQLITQQGLTVITNPKRLQAMLYDVCTGDRRKIRIVLVALEEGAVHSLIQDTGKQVDYHVFKHITTKLHYDTGIEISLVEDGVTCWIQALDKELSQPKPKSTTVSQIAAVPQPSYQPVQIHPQPSINNQTHSSDVSATRQSLRKPSLVQKFAIPVILVFTIIIIAAFNLGKSISTDRSETADSSVSLDSSQSNVNSTSSVTKHAVAITAATSNTDFIFPYSSEQRLTEEDLAGLDAKKLRIARNEIFARHGFRFKSEDLQQYFATKSWYKMDDSYSGAINAIEEYNVNLIKAREEVVR